MISKLARLPIRAFRHVLLDAAASRITRPKSGSGNTGMSTSMGNPQEDVRFGALMQVLRRHDHGPILDPGWGDGSSGSGVAHQATRY
jgi:hypothetical protein